MSQFTKKAIAGTFLKLLEERSLDKISVKDIVDACQINRNTFYYYYKDIYDLLEDVMRNQVLALYAARAPGESQRDGLFRTMQYAVDHKRTLYHLYNSSRREMLEAFLVRWIREELRGAVKAAAGERAVADTDVDLIVELAQHAIVGRLLDWLRGGMKENPQELFARLEELTRGVMEQMLRNAEEIPPHAFKTGK